MNSAESGLRAAGKWIVSSGIAAVLRWSVTRPFHRKERAYPVLKGGHNGARKVNLSIKRLQNLNGFQMPLFPDQERSFVLVHVDQVLNCMGQHLEPATGSGCDLTPLLLRNVVPLRADHREIFHEPLVPALNAL